MIDNILFLNRIYTPAIPKEPVYFAPELNVSINKGNLIVHYAHGRYGYWTYSFRYQNSDFELIGYDSSQDHGPVVERSVSINLMTKKMLIRENINQDAEGGTKNSRKLGRNSLSQNRSN